MFIVTLNYKVSTDLADRHMPAHIDWLETAFTNGVFVAAGRLVPRTGGVLISMLSSREDLSSELERDPFRTEGVADYAIVEVDMTRAVDGFDNLLGI